MRISSDKRIEKVALISLAGSGENIVARSRNAEREKSDESGSEVKSQANISNQFVVVV